MDPGREHDHAVSDDDLASRLESSRALPSAAFRGALGRRLAAQDPGYGPRPANLWTNVTALALMSAILVALGTLQAIGGL